MDTDQTFIYTACGETHPVTSRHLVLQLPILPSNFTVILLLTVSLLIRVCFAKSV
jgi:hypothetical protein